MLIVSVSQKWDRTQDQATLIESLRSLPGVKRGGPRNASPRERGPD